ncbi:14394_t:CDS:2 [Entrophospora sp. SA101]|nr:14394_t:CDS:2 [Entrophospora sp. SA101]
MDKALTSEYLDWYAKLTGLPSILSDKIRFKLYENYKEETGLDPWINFETSGSSQIEKDNIIKISKFPEEKSVILEAAQKQFPFLSYINSNAWHWDVFKYTNSEAKCLICNEVHTHRGIWGDWSCLGKNDHYFLNCPFRIDQKKVIIAIQSLLETQIKVPNKTNVEELPESQSKVSELEVSESKVADIFDLWYSESFDFPGSDL